MCKISVLMSVYNEEEYLSEAIDSILQQTFTNFEFLIIDDGSQDRSESIIASYIDDRIRLVRNKKNIGLTKSLNVGLKLANGKYIARMDADDISLPERLEVQHTFMEEHPAVGVCGSWVIQRRGNTEKIAESIVEHDDIVAMLLFNNCIAHPTVFIRKSVVLSNHQYYDEDFIAAQDYEYWTRLGRFSKLHNLPVPLLINRKHEKSISHDASYRQATFANSVRVKLLKQLKIIPTKMELDVHRDICNKIPPETNTQLAQRKEWLFQIYQHNQSFALYNQDSLRKSINKYWWFAIVNLTSYNWSILWTVLFKSPLFWPKINLPSFLRIFAKRVLVP